MSARHVSHCLQDDPWNCPGCRADMRRELGVPVPADFPELRDLRAVAEAARELTHWDWLHLLDESVHSRDVRADVAALRDALAKLDGAR